MTSTEIKYPPLPQTSNTPFSNLPGGHAKTLVSIVVLITHVNENPKEPE